MNRNRLMLPPSAQQPDFGKFIAALRRKFKSPREVMERLGLDQSLIESLLRPSTRDGIVYDARRGRGRDAAEVVEAPTDVDPDERERQAGVDRRRFSRGRDQEVPESQWEQDQRGAAYNGRDQESPLARSKIEDPEANSAEFATDDEFEEERRREVLEQDHEEWGQNYDSRRTEVYGLLRGNENVTHDEAEEYIGRFGLGKMPRSGMSGGIGGRVGRREVLRTNGIDAQFSSSGGEGLEGIREASSHIGIAGGHSVPRNVDSDPGFTRRGYHLNSDAVTLDTAAVIYDRLSDGNRRDDRLLSFGSNRQLAPAKLASDAAVNDFESRFPESTRLRRDGSNWNR